MQSILTFVTTKPLTHEGFPRWIYNTHNLSNPASFLAKYCSTWREKLTSNLSGHQDILTKLSRLVILFMVHSDAFTNLEHPKSIAWHSKIFFTLVICHLKKCFGPFFFSRMVGIPNVSKVNLFIYLFTYLDVSYNFKVSKINKISQLAHPISFVILQE